MAFNTYTFLIFFGIVLALHYSPLTWKFKKKNLLIASYIFYAAAHPPFVILLASCTLFDFFAGKCIEANDNRQKRKFFLLTTLGVNIGMLCYFKYATFFLNNFILLLNNVGIQYQPVTLNMILPLGISFFTFQSLTYSIDIYRRKAKPWPSFWDFALFVSFFPKLILGPITRAFYFLPQCEKEIKKDTKKVEWGIFLVLLGLFEKIVVADNIMAPVADRLFNNSDIPDIISAWCGTLSFTSQIFMDFSGYSNCAIGVALCLGMNLPQNFKCPYAAIGFSDFWRRWHITLSNWLKDYLYIPMGGNKKGTLKTFINLMVTMMLGGLWHGASWTFIAWGGLHGFFLVTEKCLKKMMPENALWSKQAVQLAIMLLTFTCVSLAWVFFRADTFDHALRIFKALFDFTFTPANSTLGYYDTFLAVGVTVMILTYQWIMREESLEKIFERLTWHLKSSVIASMCILIVTSSGEDRAFIYFQF